MGFSNMTHDAAETQLPFCLGVATLWNALDADPLTSVLVVSLSGKVVHANERAAQYLIAPNADPRALTGRAIVEALPKTAGEHYLQLFAQVQASGTPLLLREVWQGRQVVTRFQFVRPEHCEDAAYAEGVILAVGRRVEGSLEQALGAETDAYRLIAPYVHLGPLDVLSDRELEVLSLLCTGLTAKEIATKLDRSFKTVENHRYVIGRKLGATDRHALAAIAIRAGLTSMDALRPRL
jgi:DNA-binding CsgD family transcriptional regulator